MTKTIMITGATDGIGLETAKKMASLGHNLLIHGRNAEKLSKVHQLLDSIPEVGNIESFIADLSIIAEVKMLIEKVTLNDKKLDVLINNAGVFKIPQTTSKDGLDTRFAVNTLAPYMLSRGLMSLFNKESRIINLSSAAQAPINIKALTKAMVMEDMQAYAQSKRAIRLWSKRLSMEVNSPIIIAVNPGSLLASKMVKEGFGVEGSELSIGVNILTSLSLDEDAAKHSGEYFDNDIGEYSSDIPVDEESRQAKEVIEALDKIVNRN